MSESPSTIAIGIGGLGVMIEPYQQKNGLNARALNPFFIVSSCLAKLFSDLYHYRLRSKMNNENSLE